MPRVPLSVSLTLGNDIGGGDKPRHAHVAAKEIILDNVNFYTIMGYWRWSSSISSVMRGPAMVPVTTSICLVP